MTTEVRDQRSTWTMIVPIAHLQLTDRVDREVRVDRVTFVHTDRLPYVRKRLGINQRIGDLRKSGSLNQVLDPKTKAAAVLRLTGVLRQRESEFFTILREELDILNSSFLGFPRNRFSVRPTLAKERPRGSRDYLFLHKNGKTGWRRSEFLAGLGQDVDGFWVRSAKENFFYPMLRIIRGETKVSRGWRTDIRNAALLVGQSQGATDLPMAFLQNMIALELLLTQQGDGVGDALPERAEAFLGWTGFWESADFEKRIRDLYRKRCLLVHQGARDEINIEDLLFSDDLLLNLFSNLVRHPRQFDSKAAVVRFSERVRAERVLGVDAGSRPKTLRAQFRVTSRAREMESAF